MTHINATPFLANALQFAFEKSTTEGKLCIGTLVLVSIISWTVMITKGIQLYRAGAIAKKFFIAFRATRDPLELNRKKDYYDGAPAFEVYHVAAEELAYQLQHNAVVVKGQNKITPASYDSVRVSLERAVGAEALSLEKGMIVLSTAVAGGPFIGLLGTVWGVMETFSGIAVAKSASLTAMAPGVAGALIATVTGLMVAIPAMFAYNFMITSIRAITQELDNFASEYGTQIEHKYVDSRPLAEEITDALRAMERHREDSALQETSVPA